MIRSNKCHVRFYGPVKEMLKFMVDNMDFVRVNDKGISFKVGINFSKLMKENDELFMKEQHGVNLYEECNIMKVDVSTEKYRNNDDYDDYFDYDNPPRSMYKFRVENHGGFFDIYKSYEKEECFHDVFVTKPREFISDFFNYFSQGSVNSREEFAKLQERINMSSVLEIEFSTFSFPLNILNEWKELYNLAIRAHWADENEVLIYARYPDELQKELTEDQYIQKISAKDKLQRYVELLSIFKWLDIHALVQDVCEMLYDMKDNFPVKINLELKDQEDNKPAFCVNKFKYNPTYGNISNTIYQLANGEDKFVLAKMYASLVRMHEEFINNK